MNELLLPYEKKVELDALGQKTQPILAYQEQSVISNKPIFKVRLTSQGF